MNNFSNNADISRNINVQIANLIKNYRPKIRGHTSEAEESNLRPCSVLIPLVAATSNDEEISVILIRRCTNLRRNPGEYAFPGGMFEEQDRGDPYACALREWHEEMGSTKPDLILGLLDNFLTLSGLVITPVVCWFENLPEIAISNYEVLETFYIPLNFFQAKNRRQEKIERQDKQFTSDAYYWQEKRIWGATAGIITNLMEVLAPAIE